ncbi:sigma-70 family RNA polymerase sigma factor [Myxococcota bacterium]|nr:sigma-70 family RNA polymerase sigma factor [Myxococcota bacterium]MBU1430591.1 sigma-70 family RNA polymerase sigma factor [Myxococcota bacterium]MBU1899057.1 sigma-70 family RNA polymerase sigma factor [Myxococcota bacterium]
MPGGDTRSDEPRGLDIEDLYRRFAPLVFRRARRFYDAHEAEEVVHEVFLQVMDRQHTFRRESSPVTWLYQVTTNLCLNRIRNQGRRAALLREQTPMLQRHAVQDPRQIQHAFLSDLWTKLDADLVAVGVYHFVDGMTHPEIARVLGCSPRTVVNRLQALKAQAAALSAPVGDAP